MKLWDIAKAVGAGIIRETVPGGGLLIEAVNHVLPEGKQLPASATGEELHRTIDSLPPAQRAAIAEKEFDVELTQIRQSNETLRTMLDADARNPQSTRPRIALGAFRVVAFAVVVTVSVWAYGVLGADKEIVAAVTNGWPFVLSVLGPLVVLLHAYFGVLKREHQQRMNAATGNSTTGGLGGIISSLFNRR